MNYHKLLRLRRILIFALRGIQPDKDMTTRERLDLCGRAEVGVGMVNAASRKHTTRRNSWPTIRSMELEAAFPTIYEGMGPNSSLSKEHRLDIVRAYRTLERLNLTTHPWPKGQTGPGQWNTAENSRMVAWGRSLGALDKPLSAPHRKTGR